MKVIGYIRVSSDKQDLINQKLAVLDYANRNNMSGISFLEVQSSSTKSEKHRRILELKEILESGDTLIVAELSRLGRSISEIIRLVDFLVDNEINLVTIKESIHISGEQDIQTKVIVTLFGLFAEIERDLISKRTKEALEATRQKGIKLGRPKGKGKSKLDPHKAEIKKLLDMGVPKKRVAKKFAVHVSSLTNWLKRG